MARPVLSLRNRSNSYDAPTRCRPSRAVEVEDDICSLSETLSRVSFYPSPEPNSEDNHYDPEPSSPPRSSDDFGLHPRSTPFSDLSTLSRRAPYTFEDVESTFSYGRRMSLETSSSIASIPEEEECENDDWSSESEGSGDDVDGSFTIVSLEEVAFPSLNDSSWARVVPGQLDHAEEERGRLDYYSWHHRYHAEDDYSQPSDSEHDTQRFAPSQRTLPTWSPSSPYASYLAHIKRRSEEAQRREAEKLVLRYQMAVADAILNRLRRQPKRRAIPRVLFARDSPERTFVSSPLATEVLCS